MKRIILLIFLFQSLFISAKVHFSEYPECFVGAVVKIKKSYALKWQDEYKYFYRSFEKGKLSKGFPKYKSFEPYLELEYTITEITDDVKRGDYVKKVLTLESGDTKLYYYAFFTVLYDRFDFIKLNDCSRYIEDSIRTMQNNVNNRIAKVDDPFLGTTTYRITYPLSNIEYNNFSNGYLSISKSYKDNVFVCYIVSFCLSSFAEDAGRKGIHIIWDNGEHYIREDILLEIDVHYSNIGGRFMYNYAAQLVLSEDEYEVFCNNRIAKMRLGNGVDDMGDFQKNGEFFKYCFNVMKRK